MSALPDQRVDDAGMIDPLLLEYDYFKHLSTISLVALGAILTFAQGNKLAAPVLVMISVTLVAISAITAFGAMNHIISHRKSGKPLRWLFRSERGLASGTFAAGLGLFMSEVGKTLN